MENDNLEKNKVVGKAFEDMTITEMNEVQGAGDTQAETTPLTTVTTSSFACGAGISAGATVVLSIKKCK